MCLGCVSKWEQGMKEAGTYDDFMKQYHKENFDVAIKDVIAEYNDWLDKRNSKHYITEAGDIEDWSKGKDSKELKKEFNKKIKKTKKQFEKNNESK